jgi:hypothetical protein
MAVTQSCASCLLAARKAFLTHRHTHAQAHVRLCGYTKLGA